jgi:DNA-binding response OmpR family regulator
MPAHFQESQMQDHDSVGRSGRSLALLIETDEAYRAVITASLRLAGCRVDQAPTADIALPALERRSYDLVVWGVSSCDSDRRSEVISEVRLRTEVPLVLIDGGSDSAQFALESGADQWLPKPFVPGALIGAVRAALRKSASPVVGVASRLEMRGMVLDGKTRRVAAGGREVAFTRQEWNLLSILVSHPNRYLGAREILRLGWRAGDHEADQLRTYVRRLRQKLEPLEVPCRLISQHGHGYCLAFS